MLVIRRIIARLADERAITLALALGVMFVLSIAGTSAIYYASTNARSADMSKGYGAAYSLAEAGLNNAMAILLLPSNNALDKYVLCPDSSTLPTLPCTRTDTYSTGTVQWYGTLVQNPAAGTAYWDIVTTGYVRNPTGGRTTSQLKKTIKAKIPIVPTVTQPLNNRAWDYVLARNPGSGVAFSGCDMTIQQSVNVTSPLYVMGNLCLKNQAKITKGPLNVVGSLDQQSNQNTVGTSAVPLNEVHIGRGCRFFGQSSHTPCLYGAAGNPTNADNVFATILDGTPRTLTPPTVLWNDWYLNASPGPYYPCQTSSGPVPVFDNVVAAMSDSDANKISYRNNSAGLIDLTPGSSYTCKNINGEISWNATTRVLTVNGTIFIDGSVKVANGAIDTYSGAGTIYISGTLLIKGAGTKLCAGASNTACTTANWDSTKDLLGFVVNGNGATGSPDSQVNVGDSVQVVSGYLMGAIYATNAIDIDTSSSVDGPLDGSTVMLGQSTSSTFAGFTFVPVGMPGNNAVYALALAPQFASG